MSTLIFTINFNVVLLFSSMENDVRNDDRRRSNHPAMTTVLKEWLSKGLQAVASTERPLARRLASLTSTLFLYVLIWKKKFWRWALLLFSTLLSFHHFDVFNVNIFLAWNVIFDVSIFYFSTLIFSTLRPHIHPLAVCIWQIVIGRVTFDRFTRCNNLLFNKIFWFVLF